MYVHDLPTAPRDAVERMMDNLRSLGKGDCWPHLSRSGDHLYAKFSFEHSSYEYHATLTFSSNDDKFTLFIRPAEWLFWKGRISCESQLASVTKPLTEGLTSSFIEGVEFQFVR